MTRFTHGEGEIDVLLSHWFKVGEKVVLTGPDNQATIIGFGKRYIPRGGKQHKDAGVYIDYTRLRVVRHRDWQKIIVDVSCLGYTRLTSERREFFNTGHISELMVKIGNLPETRFWEGDAVRLKSVSPRADPTGWVVEEIDYTTIGRVMGCTHKLRGAEPSGNGIGDGYIHTTKCTDNLELLKRGNLWKMEHGEPMEFASIDEEAKFYHSLGMSHKVVNPQHVYVEQAYCPGNEFLWGFAEGVRAIECGTADQLIIKYRGSLVSILTKYENEEFGERMREYELKRLGVTTAVLAS